MSKCIEQRDDEEEEVVNFDSIGQEDEKRDEPEEEDVVLFGEDHAEENEIVFGSESDSEDETGDGNLWSSTKLWNITPAIWNQDDNGDVRTSAVSQEKVIKTTQSPKVIVCDDLEDTHPVDDSNAKLNTTVHEAGTKAMALTGDDTPMPSLRDPTPFARNRSRKLEKTTTSRMGLFGHRRTKTDTLRRGHNETTYKLSTENNPEKSEEEAANNSANIPTERNSLTQCNVVKNSNENEAGDSIAELKDGCVTRSTSGEKKKEPVRPLRIYEPSEQAGVEVERGSPRKAVDQSTERKALSSRQVLYDSEGNVIYKENPQKVLFESLWNGFGPGGVMSVSSLDPDGELRDQWGNMLAGLGGLPTIEEVSKDDTSCISADPSHSTPKPRCTTYCRLYGKAFYRQSGVQYQRREQSKRLCV